ncbi:MAG: hypothetical protein VR65_01775 [Desulfobulbaceae bacterium BRH_c16a]|nr:MAG: hypothetical protein VR65_01775 [Desulfobulbaceae bacterium BRH_c16a]
MMNEQHPMKRKATPCPGCGGSGQTSYFAGESRFMLTWEDCPDCCGTGVLLDSGNDSPGKIFSGGRSSQDETPE